MYETLELAREAGLATIMLNRPALNLINRLMVDELRAAAAELGSDETIRVVVITAPGERVFTAGVDLHEMKDLDRRGALEFITSLHQAIRGFREMDQVVIAAINGHCLGGGCELAMACDIRIAADNALIGLPEIQVGIPSVIEAALMPRLMGMGRAREMVFLGDSISAADAQRAGLVSRVVPRRELRSATRQVTDRLLGYSPTALRLQKRIVNRWMLSGFQEAIDFSVEAFGQCFATGEPHEAMSAFLEKRPPRFG